MTSAIALAPRPVARALDPAPARAVARQPVLVAPPKPKPPPAPGKAELKELYPSLTWHKSQPNAEIPITQVPRGGVDLGSTHGKRLRVDEGQIVSAFDRMRQNQVLETAKVMRHNDLVQQKWDAAAAKASVKGKRLPPPPKLQPMPPLRPATIASFEYKTSSNFFNRKDGVTKFTLVPPPGANAGDVDLSKCTVKVASKEHSHGFFGSLAIDFKDGVKAVGKALDKAPSAWLAGAANLLGTAAGGLAGKASLSSKLGGVVDGLQRGRQVAGAIEQGIRAKDPGAVLQGVGGAVDLGADLLGGVAPPIVKDIAGGIRTAGGIADAIKGAFGK